MAGSPEGVARDEFTVFCGTTFEKVSFWGCYKGATRARLGIARALIGRLLTVAPRAPGKKGRDAQPYHQHCIQVGRCVCRMICKRGNSGAPSTVRHGEVPSVVAPCGSCSVAVLRRPRPRVRGVACGSDSRRRQRAPLPSRGRGQPGTAAATADGGRRA